MKYYKLINCHAIYFARFMCKYRKSSLVHFSTISIYRLMFNYLKNGFFLKITNFTIQSNIYVCKWSGNFWKCRQVNGMFSIREILSSSFTLLQKIHTLILKYNMYSLSYHCICIQSLYVSLTRTHYVFFFNFKV